MDPRPMWLEQKEWGATAEEEAVTAGGTRGGWTWLSAVRIMGRLVELSEVLIGKGCWGTRETFDMVRGKLWMAVASEWVGNGLLSLWNHPPAPNHSSPDLCVMWHLSVSDTSLFWTFYKLISLHHYLREVGAEKVFLDVWKREMKN